MWLSGFCLVLLFFTLPETSPANILYRRTRRLRKLTGRPNLRCESELVNEQNNHIVHDVLVSTARGFALNFQEPIVFVLNLYTCLIYGLLYVWFESFSVVFGEIYGFSLPIEGLSFVGILVGAIVVLPPYCAYLYYAVEPKFNDKGEIKPEERLPFAFVGAFLVPVALFIFGWTSRESIHWIVPIIGSAIFIMGAVLLFVSYISNHFPHVVLEYSSLRSSLIFLARRCQSSTTFRMHILPMLHPCWPVTTLCVPHLERHFRYSVHSYIISSVLVGQVRYWDSWRSSSSLSRSCFTR